MQLAGQGRLSLNTQRWLGDKGKLLTNGTLTIQAGELQLNHAETQAGQITVNADTLSHQGGVMQQQGKDTLSLTTRRLDGNLNLKATTVDNRHGNIVAAEKGSLTLAVKDTLDNQSGRVLSGGQLTLRTGDVDNTGGIIAADGKTTLTSADWLDRPAGIYVQNDKGALSLSAINNVQLTASDVKNAGKDGHTEITAGHNLTLDALSTRRTEQGDWGKDNYRHLTHPTRRAG